MGGEPWVLCSLSPPRHGTHVLETADRSSLVAVILQELPPVEPQDQRWRQRGVEESGVWNSGSSHSRPLAPEEPEEAGPFPTTAASQPQVHGEAICPHTCPTRGHQDLNPKAARLSGVNNQKEMSGLSSPKGK